MEKNNHSVDKKNEPTIANGIDNDEELEANATEREVKRGNYTRVTKLVYDEYDPSTNEQND